MATGGAGYEMLRTKRSGHKAGTVKDTEAIINYIKSKTPIYIETGNRLHIKTHTVGPSSSSMQIKAQLTLHYIVYVAHFMAIVSYL